MLHRSHRPTETLNTMIEHDDADDDGNEYDDWAVLHTAEVNIERTRFTHRLIKHKYTVLNCMHIYIYVDCFIIVARRPIECYKR